MDGIWDSIDWKWDGHQLPSEGAVEQATLLLKATKEAGVSPEAAGSGWSPTVRLFWDGGKIEVEVFADSFELNYHPSFESKDMYSISEFEASLPGTISKLVVKISDLLRRS